MDAIQEFTDIKTADGVCDAFVTYPKEPGRFPAVLFLMDGYGPRPWLYEMAALLAAHGYYVLLPNLLYRKRRAPVVDLKFPLKEEDMAGAREALMALLKDFDSARAVLDAGTYMQFLSTRSQVCAGGIGIAGYCLGGGLGIRIAAAYPQQVAAVASFHSGRLATDAPDSPHLLLNRIRAELYIGHADADASMPPEQIVRLEKALQDSALKYQTEMYAGAKHGFTMADLPHGDFEALGKHWIRLFDLMDRNLKV